VVVNCFHFSTYGFEGFENTPELGTYAKTMRIFGNTQTYYNEQSFQPVEMEIR
jgi:hypothetical protein